MPAPKIRSRADAKFASAPTDPSAIAPPDVAPGLSAFRNAAPTSKPPCSYCAPTLHCRLFAKPVSLLKLYVPPNESRRNPPHTSPCCSRGTCCRCCRCRADARTGRRPSCRSRSSARDSRPPHRIGGRASACRTARCRADVRLPPEHAAALRERAVVHVEAVLELEQRAVAAASVPFSPSGCLARSRLPSATRWPPTLFV